MSLADFNPWRRRTPRRGSEGISGRELFRQGVHLAVGGIALTLPYLTRWEAAGICVLALLNNYFVLPRLPLTQRLFRVGESLRGGIVLYPLMVLLVVVAAPHYPAVPAATWSILAVGDAASGVFGRWIGGYHPLPYNSNKSWAGLLAFVLFAFPAALFVLMWCDVKGSHATLAAGGASLVAGLVETLPWKWDDNITVVVSAGLFLTLCFWLMGVAA